MFDLGISEIAVVGVVALVVLGPERLPKVARTAGHLFGRLQRYVANVKADISREMDMSELAKVKQEVQSAVSSFESAVQDHANALQSEARAIEKSANQPVAEATPAATEVPAPTQQALLDAQEAGLPSATATASEPVSTNLVATTHSPPPTAQPAFDLGIEAPRRIAR